MGCFCLSSAQKNFEQELIPLSVSLLLLKALARSRVLFLQSCSEHSRCCLELPLAQNLKQTSNVLFLFCSNYIYIFKSLTWLLMFCPSLCPLKRTTYALLSQKAQNSQHLLWDRLCSKMPNLDTCSVSLISGVISIQIQNQKIHVLSVSLLAQKTI